MTLGDFPGVEPVDILGHLCENPSMFRRLNASRLRRDPAGHPCRGAFR